MYTNSFAKRLLPALVLVLILFSGLSLGCTPSKPEPAVETPHSTTVMPPESPTPENWTELFDGKTMGDWKVIRFTGNDEASVEDGKIVLTAGYPLAGIAFQNEKIQLPTNNYELELQAMKIDGTDFFCCLTFPVADEYCSLVAGGWGGTVSGISCIDGDDASENRTKTVRKYDKNKWYTFRVQVTDKKLTCFLDDELFVDLPLDSVKLSLRTEVDNCKPLSLCSFSTSAAYRNIRVRTMNEDGANDDE